MSTAPAGSARPVGLRPSPQGETSALWNRAYVFLCLAVFLTYVHAGLLTPAIPLYVTDLGGSVVVAGFLIAAHALASFAVRPFVGLIADRWSVPGVMLLGAIVLGVFGVACFTPWLWVLGLANIVRGVGWAAVNIASYTMLAAVSPVARRGEASGYFSVATNSAHAIGPAVALWLIATPEFGFGSVFLLAGGAALAAGVAVRLIGQGQARSQRPERRAGGGQARASGIMGLLDRGVLLAAGLLVCMTLTYAASSAFIPLYGHEVGVNNTGGYFVAGGVVSIASRLLFNRVLDWGGRGLWIVVGFSLMIGGFSILLVASTVEMLLVAGVVHALGSSIAHPILLALAIDRSNPERPAASLATFSMAYQMGTAVGAPVAGYLAEWFGYRGMFVGAIVAIGVGVVVAAINWATLQRRPVAATPASAPAM